MSDATTEGAPPDPLPGDPNGPPWALTAFVGVAVLVLIIGFVVWVGGRGDEVTTATTASLVTGTTLPDATTTTDSTTTSTSTSTTSTSTSTSTTVSPSTVAPTTEPPLAFVLPEPGATTWAVPSDFDPIRPGITLELATTEGDIRAFDGVVDDARCIGVVGPGEAVTTWCGPAGLQTSFLADRGLEPLLVEVGATAGSIAVAPQVAGWTLASNGCAAPVSTILAAVDPGALPVTDIICRGDEAFVGIGSTWIGPDVAPDGGGVLVGGGDEGWDVIGGFGTSIDCGGWPDGVDRCTLYGVQFELFEALLPVPPADVLGASAVDVVDVADRTADVEAWIGDETDPDAIESILVDQLDDPDAEVPASVRRAELLQFGRLEILIVEIPQFDDAFRFETWAIWIGSLEETSGVTAFSWATCARGVTGDGLCV